MSPLSPPSPCHDGSNPSDPNPTEISKECQQCLAYLTNALNQPGRTQTLLKALGAVPPINTTNNNNKDQHRMYTPTPDGRGVILQLNAEHALHSPILLDPNEHPKPRVSLQKRLTNVASRMVGYGVSNPPADNVADDNPDGVVLTTSPKNNIQEMHNMTKQEMPKETTITIECMKCGTDTPAEAGGEYCLSYILI